MRHHERRPNYVVVINTGAPTTAGATRTRLEKQGARYEVPCAVASQEARKARNTGAQPRARAFAGEQTQPTK
jgi:hypothetical protein